MGWFTTALKIGSMMDWATPTVNLARKARGMTPVLFEDHELVVAERIIKRHGGRGLDITWDGGWSMMVPADRAGECQNDIAQMRAKYEY